MLHFKLAPCEEAARNLAAVILDFLVSTYAVVRPLILKLCSKSTHNLPAHRQMPYSSPMYSRLKIFQMVLGKIICYWTSREWIKKITLCWNIEAVATWWLHSRGCWYAMKVVLSIVHRPAPCASYSDRQYANGNARRLLLPLAVIWWCGCCKVSVRLIIPKSVYHCFLPCFLFTFPYQLRVYERLFNLVLGSIAYTHNAWA